MKILKPLEKKQRKHKKLMGFDIETAGDKNEFVLGCFYADDVQKICKSKTEVIKFLNSEVVRGYHIFATNLAFDFLGCLFEHSDQWSVTERNGIIYSFRWYQTKCDGVLQQPVHFYDTIRLYSASVEKLGELLKQPKMQHPSCFGKFPQSILEQYELENYCMNDAKISFMFVKNIVYPILDKYNLKLKSTIGSLALQDFQTNHLKQTLFQESDYCRETAFKSYYGGRTETFQRGLFKNVYCFDINSLYPSVMRELMPNPNRSYKIEKPMLKHICKYEGVSHVLVEVPNDIKIPPLPYKKDNKLIFPTGTFKGYYNHNEIRNAMSYGVRVLEVYETLIYPKTEYLFRSFVDTHYKERLRLQAEKNPLEVLEKNILNNLYGKFAFNYNRSSSLIPAHDFDYDKHVEKAKLLIPMFNNQFISVEDSKPDVPSYSFPILSSYITSYARIKMYKYLSNPMIQDKIISTDTDSIFIKDYENEIETSNELGEMKLEKGYPVKEGYFVRPKMYMTAKPKCKGLKLTSNDEFISLLKGNPAKQLRFTKYRTLIKSLGKLQPNEIMHLEKNIDLEDTKRVWSLKFNPFDVEQSKPIVLNYLQEELEQETKRTNETAHMLNVSNNYKDLVHQIIDLDSDLVDWNAKGDDITKEEFIKNEMSFEFI